MRSTNDLQTRPIGFLSDPTRERVVGNQKLRESSSEGGRNGGWVGGRREIVDEKILNGEAEEELGINGGKGKDTWGSGLGRSEEKGVLDEDGSGSRHGRKRVEGGNWGKLRRMGDFEEYILGEKRREIEVKD